MPLKSPNKEMAIEALSSSYADLVAFGRLFIANPDLVRRFKENAALNNMDSAALYGGTAIRIILF